MIARGVASTGIAQVNSLLVNAGRCLHALEMINQGIDSSSSLFRRIASVTLDLAETPTPDWHFT